MDTPTPNADNQNENLNSAFNLLERASSINSKNEKAKKENEEESIWDKIKKVFTINDFCSDATDRKINENDK